MGRRYGLGGPWVLRQIDLELHPGSLVRVQGGNGSGKSTLLRLLAGIDAPTEGRITGRPRTAYVPERFPAAMPFTASGYLLHLGHVHGLGRREATTGAAEWAAAVVVVVLISDPSSAGHRVEVRRLPAAGAGLLACAVCVLLGTAVGALGTRPLLHTRGWSLTATVLMALLALVISGSPARVAVTGLVTGSFAGTVPLPLPSLLAAALIAAAAAGAACALVPLRGAADGGAAR